MSILFEKIGIGGLELPNRFVRSATWEGMATEEGVPTDRLTGTMKMLADGMLGLIMSSHAYVSKEGQAGPWQLGVYSDALLERLKEMTEAVHGSGGRIAMQLAHAGCFAAMRITEKTPLVVSPVEKFRDTPQKEISSDGIAALVAAFVDAAVRAKSAGFDGVQIHSAHGYLLSQFLSPIFNKRSDEYGGKIAGRARIHCEIIRSIRESTGPAFPILIKMNCQDFADGGLSPEDSLDAAEMFADAGVDAIELSGGLLTGGELSPSRPGINKNEKEAYFKEYAREMKKRLSIPVLLVGGIRSFEVCERLVEDGIADCVSMSRPLIREPGLVRRWMEGDRQRAKCVSDNLCFRPGFSGEGVYCVTEEKEEGKKSG